MSRRKPIVARYIFTQLGVAPGRVIYEERARDTWENFVYSRPLAKPKPGEEVWLLAHVRLSHSAARHGDRGAKWAGRCSLGRRTLSGRRHTRISRVPRSLSENLGHLDLAAHEWAGLIAYRLAGRAR